MVENVAKIQDMKVLRTMLKGTSPGAVTRKVPHLEREMDQMKRVMEEMKDSMKRVNHVDDLVHRTDSPFYCVHHWPSLTFQVQNAHPGFI